MSRETTITVHTPAGVRITVKEILDHIRKLDGRLVVKLKHSFSTADREELRAIMEQRLEELAG